MPSVPGRMICLGCRGTKIDQSATRRSYRLKGIKTMKVESVYSKKPTSTGESARSLALDSAVQIRIAPKNKIATNGRYLFALGLISP